MSDYTELVKALRHCMTKEDGITICAPCPYYGKGIECENVLHTDAAAAIEELQDKVVELEEELNDADVAADDNGRQIEELQAEVKILKVSGREAYFEGLAAEPERGRWVGVSPTVDTVQCSVCGGQLFSEELETPYCPYCGAKMEVQDG